MVTHANWKIENGVLVILCTDGQGWWHPVKVSIAGEHGETCIVRQEARVDEDWSHEQGDDRVLADYGKGFRGISAYTRSPYGWAIPENREEDKCSADLPEVLKMRPEQYIRLHIPENVQGVDRWNRACDMAINSIIEKFNQEEKPDVQEWDEWASAASIEDFKNFQDWIVGMK